MRINAAIRRFVYAVKLAAIDSKSARLNPDISIVPGTERFVAPSFSNVQIDLNRMQK